MPWACPSPDLSLHGDEVLGSHVAISMAQGPCSSWVMGERTLRKQQNNNSNKTHLGILSSGRADRREAFSKYTCVFWKLPYVFFGCQSFHITLCPWILINLWICWIPQVCWGGKKIAVVNGNLFSVYVIRLVIFIKSSPDYSLVGGLKRGRQD